jgi:hypothetical protein
MVDNGLGSSADGSSDGSGRSAELDGHRDEQPYEERTGEATEGVVDAHGAGKRHDISVMGFAMELVR